MLRIVTALLAATLVCPSLGLAKKPDKAKQKKAKEEQGSPDGRLIVTFDVRHRQVAREYFVETRGRGKCPPGLAKKNNGCLPPGQAKKRYAVGRRLSERVVLEEPPPELIVRIGRPPDGYRYAVLDGDLIKLAVGTLLVVDAIEGLVN
ncbi:MAG: hypothetical protein ABW221_09335 [Vicinamibacteria bacterium]